jgi:hypothetical protein
VRRKSPAEIATIGEIWAQNRKYPTCAAAAMRNGISALINGYNDVRVVTTYGDRLLAGTGELPNSAISPTLFRVDRTSHSVAAFEDDLGNSHALSGGNDFGNNTNPEGLVFSYSMTRSLLTEVQEFHSDYGEYTLPPSH